MAPSDPSWVGASRLNLDDRQPQVDWVAFVQAMLCRLDALTQCCQSQAEVISRLTVDSAIEADQIRSNGFTLGVGSGDLIGPDPRREVLIFSADSGTFFLEPAPSRTLVVGIALNGPGNLFISKKDHGPLVKRPWSVNTATGGLVRVYEIYK